MISEVYAFKFTHIHYPQSCGSVRIIAVKWESRQSIPQSFANCQYAYILIDSYSDTIKPTSNDLQPIYCIIISDLIMSFAVIHCLFFKHFFLLWIECCDLNQVLNAYGNGKRNWKSTSKPKDAGKVDGHNYVILSVNSDLCRTMWLATVHVCRKLFSLAYAAVRWWIKTTSVKLFCSW